MRLRREVQTFVATGYLVAMALGLAAGLGMLGYALLIRFGLVLR